MKSTKDYYMMEKLLRKYVKKYGANEFFRLLANTVIDLSYYEWNKEEKKAIHSVMAALHEVQVKVK
jgi:hypothetical protein